MPWGCLCSKEKKRPQISSPILKSDESAKQQLLPASSRRAQVTSTNSAAAAASASKLEQRLLAGESNLNNDPNNQSSNTPEESSEEFAPNGGSGGLKRDRLQQQLIQKSRLKSSNLKSSSYTRNTENDKLTRHLNNVTFAFDEPQRQRGSEVRSGELIRLEDEGDGNGNYDVLQPVVPPEQQQNVVLQIVEKTDENSNVHLNVPQQQPDIVKSSTESIPYIDDEQSQILKNLNRDPNKVRNFHDARIITLTPKNVGSQAAKRAGPSSPELRQLVLAKKLPPEPAAAVSLPTQPLEPEVAASRPAVAAATVIQFSHSFHILTGVSGCDRVCQQCHQILTLDVALRCAICEFTCHQRCVVLQQPKSRYTDTSYLIFQQLKEGGLQCAFPAIWDLLHPGISTGSAAALPDELPAGVEPLVEPGSSKNGNGKKPAGQYKVKDSRKSAGSGIPRKQSKIAEKRKNRKSLELKAVEEAPREEEEAAVVSVVVPVESDEKKLQICDMSGSDRGRRHVSVISSSGDDESGSVVQKDIQVAVDFHHRPNSEVEPSVGRSETNNNDVRCKSHNDPPELSDVESVRTVTPGPGNGRPREVDRGKEPPGVQIRRKQYDLYELPYLTGSEYSESDFTDTASSVGGGEQDLELVLADDRSVASSTTTVEYATVEVRQKNQEDEQQQIINKYNSKNQEDEQQQIINKYNSLPLHALQNQQYQSPHLQQSRPASSLSHHHVNNNNGNHYHNYSSAHHHNNNANSNGLHQSWNGNNGATGPDSSSSGPLRLSYVTERILASILPARRRYRNGSITQTTPGSPGFVDEHERELIEMLEQKHERNYRIFDLESCIASISLEKLCELCKHIDSWLGSGKEKIVVLQDRSDKQRLGAAIAAYLEYQKICGSNFPQSNRTKALPSPGGPDGGRRTPTWLDLDLYSTQRFLESVTGPLRVPSHKRYIRYFSGLLAGTIKMNSSSVFLRAIIVESPPCLHYRAVTVNSEWRSFIKVYEGVRCLFTSDIYVIPITTRQFIYEIKHPLRLRGDVLVRCYQIIPNNNKLHDEKELISAVQFHTCAITEKEVQFTKLELDLACDDERFPADHKLTLCIDTVPNEKSAILVFQNPLVRIEPIIENGDHLETINGADESSHTQGPLDGSLYATILKSPKSPTPATPSGSSHQQQQQQTLISPPAEFSNGKPLLLNGSGSGSGAPPPVTPPPRSSTPGYLYESAKRYHQSNGTTTLQQRSYKVASESNVGNDNNNNSNGNYRDVIENGNSATAIGAAYDQNQNPLGPGGSVVSGSTGSAGRSGGSHTAGQSQVTVTVRSQADGRESVRSPLTLSMDSGISSSGVVNRRLQGSSVSPSSFPSQASPQDDRHRELDDLLSDMLMTVQGIPDAISRNKQQQQHQQSQHHQADHFVNTSTDTIKRSHSVQLPALREEPTSSAAAKERELLMYETSSTTTTLTPPPSESGRDTPLLSSTSNYSTIRDKRELTGGALLTPTERELIMNLQQHQSQSFGYPRQARSTTGASERFTSDDDDDNFGGGNRQQIPYHAREDSRPFTYGSIPQTGTPQNPPASTMIKMQSGLSSPSMVRKALGTPTSGRKSASGGVTFANGNGTRPGSDFEEMLRERREKVLSEKYTIGDQSPGGGLGLNGTDTVDNANNSGRYYQTTTKTIKTVTTEHGGGGGGLNGYPAHEPLKRSNTMDGSFGRQFSNDGISGQTWLQLQQQKLRARKEQQKREHSNSFSYSYGSPAFPAADAPLYHSGTTHRRSQTLSPVRNERNYHTLTTTTRTHSTERPFVAVKRAHENAKMQSIGSAPLSVLNASPHGHVAQAQQQQQQNPVPPPSSAPSPSPSMASTIEHHHHHQHQQNNHHQQIQQQQQIQYTVSSSSQNQQNQQQPPLNGSFNGTHIQNGLLSLADQDHSTPKHGHVRLESEQLLFSNINSLNNLDTSEKLNNLLKDITNSAAAVQRAASLQQQSATVVTTAATTTTTTTNSLHNPAAIATSANLNHHQNHHQNHIRPVVPNHLNHHLNNNHYNHHHHQNGHHRKAPYPEPMDVSPDDGNAPPANDPLRIGEGQLALDKLLASLALENDVTEQHLAKIDQQPVPPAAAAATIRNANGKLHPYHETELSAVIANLTEYNLSESLGDAFRTHSDINGNNHNNNNGGYRIGNTGAAAVNGLDVLGNHHVRRIASESDSTISSISPSLSERSNAISWCDQAREESFSSYRSETEPDNSPTGGSPRPETPAFPVTPRTPYGLSNGTSSPALPPKSPTSQRKNILLKHFEALKIKASLFQCVVPMIEKKPNSCTFYYDKDLFTGQQQQQLIQQQQNQNETMSCYTSRRNSTTSNANSEPQEVAPQFVKFARDSSKYWYKPAISREEAIALLRNAPPGTFVVRDSTTFANAYGLVVKVAHPPPGVQPKAGGSNGDELVRHFLVEPTIRGVRLKGCSNEPVFTSLSALVYQHSITPLALPCRLIIPDSDLQQTDFQSPAQQQLLTQGAACNVLYLFTCDTESLTGPQAIRKAVGLLLSLRPLPKPTQVHFKVSIQGITLTDNTRQLFFRRHYPSNNVSFCGLDPDEHRWSIPSTTGDIPASKRIFAFVAKRSPTSADNQCHVFCELEATQPATAIVSFANKVVLGGTPQPQQPVARAI